MTGPWVVVCALLGALVAALILACICAETEEARGRAALGLTMMATVLGFLIGLGWRV